MVACVPEPLTIQIDQLEPAPVVWSQVFSENTAIIYFARSFGALEYNEDDSTATEQDLLAQVLVTDGLVTLSHNNEVDTLIYLSEGLYASIETDFEEGEFYTLRATDYDLGQTVTATAEMQPFISLESISSEITSQNDSSKTVDFTYTFSDLPGDSWYALNYYSSFDDPLEIQDPLEATGLSETQILSDQEFNSSTITGTYTLDFLEFDTVFVSLTSISEPYYNYLAQRQRSGSIFTQLVQEPINYPSNVEGGYGFFNLSIPSVEMVVVGE